MIEKKSQEKRDEANVQISDCEDKVVKCEEFVNSLEQEIIEWHALQKLVRRDTDLTNIEEHTRHTLKDLKTEKDLMDDWLIKKQEAEQTEKI